MNDPITIAAVLTSLGFGGGIVAALNAFAQRRKVGAEATVVVIAAARELVDPLRQELRNERQERADEALMFENQMLTATTGFQEKLLESQEALRTCTIAARDLVAEIRDLRAELHVLKQKLREAEEKLPKVIEETNANTQQ